MKKPRKRDRSRRGDGTVAVAKRDASGKPILWRASISLGAVTIDGKRQRNRPTEYSDTEAGAYEKLRQMRARYLTGDQAAPSNQTFGDFLLQHWLPHVKAVRSPGTYAGYEARCRVHIIPAVGGLKIKTVTTEHLQMLLDSLVAKGLKPNTVSGVRATLTRAFNAARKWGRRKDNPASDTEIPPIVQKKPPSLTEAQLDRLLEAIEGDPIEPLVLIALGTGARIGECLALLWANADEKNHELHITGAIKRRKVEQPGNGPKYALVRDSYTKGKEDRTTHLPAAVADVLHARRQAQQQERRKAGNAWEQHGLIFTDAQGRPLDPSTISKRFSTIAKRASLPPGFTFHGLRHSCATFLIKQGESERTIAGILGHKDIRTTRRYGTVLAEVTRDALDKHSERLTRRRGAK